MPEAIYNSRRHCSHMRHLRVYYRGGGGGGYHYRGTLIVFLCII